MTEYTTPDFLFRLKDENIDLTMAKHVYLTMQQGNTICTRDETELEISGNTVAVWFNQEEISQFKNEGSKVEVQINWTYEDISGEKIKRAATKIKSFQVSRNLLKQVVE